MTHQLLSSHGLRAVPQIRATLAKKLVETDRVGRLIQMTLALYLMPVLLVVMVISGVGMMILGVSETIHGFSERGRRLTQESDKPGYYR